MKIREFRESDAEEVCNIVRRNDLEVSSRFYSEEVIKNWESELTPEAILEKSRGRTCFVAEEECGIEGYISLSGDEIKKLFVLPESHGKGIGRKLLDETEKKARRIDLDKLTVYSSIYAQPFYERCGFEKMHDNWSETNGFQFRTIYMEKQLK